jgi:hypothetical protein
MGRGAALRWYSTTFESEKMQSDDCINTKSKGLLKYLLRTPKSARQRRDASPPKVDVNHSRPRSVVAANLI